MTSVRRLLASLPLLAAASLAACDPADEPALAVSQPLVGVPGQGDSADRQCQVVLRQVGRVSNGRGGYQTSDGGSWIWDGTLDISAAAAREGGLPAVQYHYGSDPTWWEVYGVVDEAAPSGDGFVLYRFRLEDHLPGPGMSGTSLSRARIELAPVLHLPGGARVFDHNRRPGDFDNYELRAAGSFAIADDPAACAPPREATLSFDAAWNEAQDAAIVPGGRLTVNYDLSRLGACRGTHNGYPAWDVVVHGRFLPGGQLVQASVRAFDTVNGIPTTVAHALPAHFEVPADATAVELWFENFGLWCQAWDSNYEANYGFSVVAP